MSQVSQQVIASKTGLNPHVSVDCVVFGFDFEEIKVLLIKRHDPSVDGLEQVAWALPGDLIRDVESLDAAANRVLNELTGLDNIFLQQFHAFGNPDRVRRDSDAQWLERVREKPDARVITVAYFSLMKIGGFDPEPSSFASEVKWFKLSEAPALAFDHSEILEVGQEALKMRLRRKPIGFELLPQKFTLGQLQKLYEAILGKSLDKRNFRKKILKSGILVSLDEKQKGVPHKPAQYYSFDPKRYDELRTAGFDFSLLE